MAPEFSDRRRAQRRRVNRTAAGRRDGSFMRGFSSGVGE